MRRALRTLSRIEDLVAGLLMAAVLGVVSYELFLRNLVGRSNLWTDELSRVLMIWMVYVAVIGVTRDGAHVRVEFIADSLPPRLRRAAGQISDLLIAGASLCLAWYGLQFVLEGRSFGMLFTHSDLPFPVWVAQTVIPICFTLTAFHALLRCIRPAEARMQAPTEV